MAASSTSPERGSSFIETLVVLALVSLLAYGAFSLLGRRAEGKSTAQGRTIAGICGELSCEGSMGPTEPGMPTSDGLELEGEKSAALDRTKVRIHSIEERTSSARPWFGFSLRQPKYGVTAAEPDGSETYSGSPSAAAIPRERPPTLGQAATMMGHPAMVPLSAWAGLVDVVRSWRSEGKHVRYISSEGDLLMTLTRALTIGEAEPAKDVAGMVDSIIANADGQPIKKLTIVGHGCPGTQAIGGEASTTGEGAQLRYDMGRDTANELARLAPHFGPDARVELHGCQVGGGPQGEQLMKTLARVWKVPIHAGTNYQNSYAGFEGTKVIVYPNGAVEYDESVFDGALRRNPGLVGDDRRAREGYHFGSIDTVYQQVVDLVGGYTSEADQRAILERFADLSPGDRRKLYEFVEHHPWSGDFYSGLMTDDDDLYNSLSRDNAAKLRELLNDTDYEAWERGEPERKERRERQFQEYLDRKFGPDEEGDEVAPAREPPGI